MPYIVTVFYPAHAAAPNTYGPFPTREQAAEWHREQCPTAQCTITHVAPLRPKRNAIIASLEGAML